MADLDLQQRVLNLLSNFRGIEPLKQLFWSLLGYERTDSLISTRGWSENITSLLAEDPTLFADHNGFEVVYVRLSQSGLSLGSERVLVAKLLAGHPHALFVFSNVSQDRWHFLNVKAPPLSAGQLLLRRITVGPEEQLRTAAERLSLLDLESIRPDLDRLRPLEIQSRHEEAFDVEKVTRKFFERYAEVFRSVEGLITGIADPDRKRLFTQRLFNRLMFIAFIQKKGWLKLGGRTDYLNALWDAYQADGTEGKDFYRDRLHLLFFSGLNTPHGVDVVGINSTSPFKNDVLKGLIGEVPYLNGGLFEQDEDDQDNGITVPDEAIDLILHGLFDCFNFTVTESTPLDVEVAVDPEMLGKVFEELVTGRHESGSYYTPKPVVAFMGREALKGYLRSELPGEAEGAIERFVDTHDPAALKDPEAVLEALRGVRVCDPACGSGAYLLGMLHELLDLRRALFATRNLDAISAYDRKLEIIQNNVYGVDIDPFAVNIARLRLWLSLAVDFDGDNPPPLPNLDFKIETGDSLLAPDPGKSLQATLRGELVQQYLALKGRYLRAGDRGEKLRLRAEIEAMKADIALWTHGGAEVGGFDWVVEFAEVFAQGGFDIVLANPPYVRMELFKPIKPILRQNFPEVHSDRADLYCYFYGRGVQLLRERGMLAYISSNQWLRANYGSSLRAFLASNCQILSITDFGELPVFQTVATFPMILVAMKGKSIPKIPVYTLVKSLAPPYPNVLDLVRQQGKQLSSQGIAGSTWTFGSETVLQIVRTMESRCISLSQCTGSPPYWGVKTGLNAAFQVDDRTHQDLVRRCHEAQKIMKPLAVGDNIRKWRVERNRKWLLYMYHGIDVSQLGVILEYLQPFRKRLEARATRQQWYELQQPQSRFVHMLEKPKIIFPYISASSRFTLDRTGLFVNNTAYFIASDDLYLLGVLNSAPLWKYARERLSVLGDASNGGRLLFLRQFVEVLPIPVPSESEKTAVSDLVSKCLSNQGLGCGEWELEIDERVSKLYGL